MTKNVAFVMYSLITRIICWEIIVNIHNFFVKFEENFVSMALVGVVTLKLLTIKTLQYPWPTIFWIIKNKKKPIFTLGSV